MDRVIFKERAIRITADQAQRLSRVRAKRIVSAKKWFKYYPEHGLYHIDWTKLEKEIRAALLVAYLDVNSPDIPEDAKQEKV